MTEYSDIKTIEELYSEDEISGKSYLFCVDNSLDTLQDLRRFIAESLECENIPEDLLVFDNTVLAEHSSTEISIDTNSHLITEETVSLENLQKLYELAIQDCSVRTKNCLDRVQSEYGYPSDDFFNYLLKPGLSLRIVKVKNAGKKTVEEVEVIVEYIKNNIKCDLASCLSNDEKNNEPIELGIEKEELISELWPVLIGLKQNLSVRCCNIIDKLINEHNSSLVCLYNYFSSPKFSCKDIRGIGKKSGEELLDFRKSLLSLINDYLQNGRENVAELIQKSKYEEVMGLGESDIELINNLSNALNRTPLFRIIDCIIKQEERSAIIISKSTRIYNNVIVNIDFACDELGLTRERVRQLRNKIFSELIDKITTWTQHYDFSHYIQYCTASWDKNDIFKEEGVDFSDDFIDIVSSILFKDNYTLVGDMQECMMSFYDRKEALFIVPNDFTNIFDFDKFLVDINQRVSEKIYEDYQLDVNHHILNYFKDTIRFDLVDDIMEYIRLMLFEKYQLALNDGNISFKKNANKKISEYIEDILETKGQIMSLDEIYEEFENKYPGLTKSKESLRGGIANSDRIVPISRSSNYALKEWKHVKSGTIKDIVYEYLLDFTTPQLLEDIEDYVQKHRPNTDANSIYNNLTLDKRGLFTILMANEQRYVAISSHEYGDEFEDVRNNSNYVTRRTFQESIDLLYGFVVTNNRFPFNTSKDEEEERLARFLGICRMRYKKGELPEEEKIILSEFDKVHGEKEISKNQYDWNAKYEELENYILENCKLPSVAGEPILYGWLSRQRKSISDGKLRHEDSTKLQQLLELL